MPVLYIIEIILACSESKSLKISSKEKFVNMCGDLLIVIISQYAQIWNHYIILKTNISLYNLSNYVSRNLLKGAMSQH